MSLSKHARMLAWKPAQTLNPGECSPRRPDACHRRRDWLEAAPPHRVRVRRAGCGAGAGSRGRHGGGGPFRRGLRHAHRRLSAPAAGRQDGHAVRRALPLGLGTVPTMSLAAGELSSSVAVMAGAGRDSCACTSLVLLAASAIRFEMARQARCGLHIVMTANMFPVSNVWAQHGVTAEDGLVWGWLACKLKFTGAPAASDRAARELSLGSHLHCLPDMFSELGSLACEHSVSPRFFHATAWPAALWCQKLHADCSAHPHSIKPLTTLHGTPKLNPYHLAQMCWQNLSKVPDGVLAGRCWEPCLVRGPSRRARCPRARCPSP